MSMSFQNDLTEGQQSFIKDLLKDQVVALDERTALLQGMIIQSKMKQVANELNEPVSVELNELGEIKTMQDGTRYQVTKEGWKKL